MLLKNVIYFKLKKKIFILSVKYVKLILIQKIMFL